MFYDFKLYLKNNFVNLKRQLIKYIEQLYVNTIFYIDRIKI